MIPPKGAAMKVLIYSDHHSHAWKPYSEEITTGVFAGVNSRLAQGLLVLDHIRQLATKVDVVLFAGDMFHIRSSLNVITFNLTYDATAKIRMACKKLGLMPGNHDQVSRDGSNHALFSFGAFATVMDKPGWHHFEAQGSKLHVLAIPYTADSDAVRDIVERNAHTRFGGGPRILLGHFGVDGGIVGSNFVLEDKNLIGVDDLKPDRFNQVFLGHYHKHQQLAPNVQYVGATMQHNWGDTGDTRGCLIWDTDVNVVKHVPLPHSPQFVKIANPQMISENVFHNYVEVPSNYNQALYDQLLSEGALSVDFVPTISSSQVAGTPYKTVASNPQSLIEHYVETNSFGVLDNEYLEALGRKMLEEAQE